MVSLDEPEKNAEFAESLDANFPLLSDPTKVAADAYGVLGFAGLYAKRWTFYIDAEGIIRKIDKDVSPGGHGAAIAGELEALGVAKKSAAAEAEPDATAPAPPSAPVLVE